MDDSAAIYGVIRWQSGDDWCTDVNCPNLRPSREPLPDQSRGPLVRIGPDSVNLQQSFDFTGLAPAVWIVGGLVALLVCAFVALVAIVLLFVVVRIFKTS